MAYREAAKPNRNFPRRRPEPTLVLHRPAAWIALAVGIVHLGFALLFVPLALGTRIDCRRTVPKETPACTLRSTIGGETRFEGTLGALYVVKRHEAGDRDDDVETMLHANGTTTRVLSETAATAAVLEYAEFVSNGDALAFQRRVPGPPFHAIIIGVALLIAIGAGAYATLGRRADRLIVDVEVDELVVEAVSLLRRAHERTYVLSKIQQVFFQPLGEQTTSYELVIVIDGTPQPLVCADASGCQRAAALIAQGAQIS
jgi:hypothetical protein